MDIGRVLKDSWTIFSKDWGALLVGALITLLLGMVTLGVLFIPLLAGLYLMVLRRVREGRKAEVGDVFGCFDRVGAYIVAYLLFLAVVLAFVVIVGAPLLLLVIHDSGARAFGWFLFALAAFAAFLVLYYLETVWIYWTILMVDRQLGVVAALAESRAIVARSGFWMTLLAVFVVGLIAGLASSLLSAATLGIGGVLAFVLMPWQVAAFTAMYFQATGEDRLLPSAWPGTSALWLGGGFFAAPFQGGGYPPPYGPTGTAGSAPPGYPPPSPPYGSPPAAPPYPPAPYAPPYGPPAAAPPHGPPGATSGPPPQGGTAAWQPPPQPRPQAAPWAAPPPWTSPTQAPPWSRSPQGPTGEPRPASPPAGDEPGGGAPPPPSSQQPPG